MNLGNEASETSRRIGKRFGQVKTSFRIEMPGQPSPCGRLWIKSTSEESLSYFEDSDDQKRKKRTRSKEIARESLTLFAASSPAVTIQNQIETGNQAQ